MFGKKKADPLGPLTWDRMMQDHWLKPKFTEPAFARRAAGDGDWEEDFPDADEIQATPYGNDTESGPIEAHTVISRAVVPVSGFVSAWLSHASETDYRIGHVVARLAMANSSLAELCNQYDIPSRDIYDYVVQSGVLKVDLKGLIKKANGDLSPVNSYGGGYDNLHGTPDDPVWRSVVVRNSLLASILGESWVKAHPLVLDRRAGELQLLDKEVRATTLRGSYVTPREIISQFQASIANDGSWVALMSKWPLDQRIAKPRELVYALKTSAAFRVVDVNLLAS